MPFWATIFRSRSFRISPFERSSRYPRGMMRVFDAPNAHLALALFSWDCLSTAAGEGTVKRAQLIPVESHDVLLIGLSAMV